MANYYYVKTGGTRTSGGGVTKKAGAFSAMAAGDYYGTLPAAYGDATTQPVGGDIICVSDGHTTEEIGGTDLISVDTSGNGLVNVVSVDDANVENYKRATSAQFSLATAVLYPFSAIYGIFFNTSIANAFNVSTSNVHTKFTDCEFNLTATSSLFYSAIDGGFFEVHDCDIVAVSGVSTVVQLRGGSGIHITGTSCTVTSGTFTGVTNAGFLNGGGYILIESCDLSAIPTIVLGAGSSAIADDTMSVKLFNCQVDASVALANESLSNIHHKIELYGCDDSTSDEPSTTKIEWFNGYLESVIGTSSKANLVTSGDVMLFEAANTYLSFKVTTNAKTTIETPFYFDIPTTVSELSVATTDNVRVHLACADTLTDADVWVEVLYSDGTTKVKQNRAVSVAQNHMRTGTTLTTDSTSTWSTGSVTNKYQIDVDTSGTVGSDCAPIVRVHINSDPTSSTIYFDSEYELVAP